MIKVDKLAMLKAGVHFGHRTSKWNPKMDSYIFTSREGVHIIDLEKTEKLFEKALEFLASIASRGGVILFVGTKKQAKEIVRKAADECKMPYVVQRWLGGTFTNFPTIAKRTKYLRELESQAQSGELKKYTKKEEFQKLAEIERMNFLMGGIKNMTRLPDAVFLIDLIKDKVAVREIKKLGIPLVAVVDTNANPEIPDYPIPANDDAINSIQFLFNTVKEVILENYQKAQVKIEPEVKKTDPESVEITKTTKVIEKND